MGVMLVTGIIAAAIAIKSAKYCAEKINAFDYKKISYSVFLILIAVVFNFSDATMQGKILGLMIFITATALGLFAITKNITRTHLMGCLLIPTILYYIL